MDLIPTPLKSRLEIITISGYTKDEKVQVAKNYMFPMMCKRLCLPKSIHLGVDVWEFIIDEYIFANVLGTVSKHSAISASYKNNWVKPISS